MTKLVWFYKIVSKLSANTIKFVRSCKLHHLFHITPPDNCFCFQSNPNLLRNWKYLDRVTICDHNMVVKLFEAMLLYLSCCVLGPFVHFLTGFVSRASLVSKTFHQKFGNWNKPFWITSIIWGLRSVTNPNFRIHISITSFWHTYLFVRFANYEI